MHQTAIQNAVDFFETYKVLDNDLVVEIGSQDVNGSIRNVIPSNVRYIGVDFVAGKGVDVILNDPYVLPFENGSVDRVVCSSCFEHSEMFWVLFLEILRVLKPRGLFYLNVPSNGPFHQYPVDCWRFYPDSGRGLVAWAKRNQYHSALLESYTSKKDRTVWNDYVAIFIRDEAFVSSFSSRIIDNKKAIYNGLRYGSNVFINFREFPRDTLSSHPYLVLQTYVLRRVIKFIKYLKLRYVVKKTD